MKRTASILTALSLAVMFFAPTAHADTDGQGVTAKIPFEFVVGGVTLPAGQYRFLSTTDGIFLVRGTDGRTVFSSIGVSIQPDALSGKSALKFVTVDGHHVLSQIWNGFADTGSEFRYGRSGTELTNPTVH